MFGLNTQIRKWLRIQNSNTDFQIRMDVYFRHTNNRMVKNLKLQHILSDLNGYLV